MPDAEAPALALSRHGSGPPLLLLHGVATERREFSRVLPALAARYDVLAVDLSGHGASPPLGCAPGVPALTDAVEGALDHAGVGSPHVLGVSLGGRLGLELARRGRVRSVVAIAPTGLALPAERLHQAALFGLARLGYGALDRLAVDALRLPPARAAALGLLRARGWRTSGDEAVALVRGFARTPGYWRVLRHAVLPEATWDYGAVDCPVVLAQGTHDVLSLGQVVRRDIALVLGFARTPGYWRLLRHAVLPEATWDYGAVDCPVVLAQGTHDVLSLGQVVRLLPLVPGARFRLLPGAGHSAVGDLPGEVVRLVDEVVAAAGRRAEG